MSTPALKDIGVSPSFPALKKKDLFSFHFFSSHDNSVRAHRGMYIQPTNQPVHPQIKEFSPSFLPEISEKSISNGKKGEGSFSRGAGAQSSPCGGRNAIDSGQELSLFQMNHSTPQALTIGRVTALICFIPLLPCSLAPLSDLSLVKVTWPHSARGSSSEVRCREETSTLRSQA